MGEGGADERDTGRRNCSRCREERDDAPPPGRIYKEDLTCDAHAPEKSLAPGEHHDQRSDGAIHKK